MIRSAHFKRLVAKFRVLGVKTPSCVAALSLLERTSPMPIQTTMDTSLPQKQPSFNSRALNSSFYLHAPLAKGIYAVAKGSMAFSERSPWLVPEALSFLSGRWMTRLRLNS
jgi:hypothetical protein